MSKSDRIKELETTLKESIGQHFPNCQFLAGFLIALFAVKTVTLPQLAEAMPGKQKMESAKGRILYFLKHAHLPKEAFAKAIVALLPFPPPWVLAIDRTNWKLGKSSINFLVLCVCFEGIGFPVLWMMLPDGCSSQKHRIDLMNRYIALFSKDSIAFLCGDREFIGKDWFTWLDQEKIGFRIRIRRDNLFEYLGGDKIPSHLLLQYKTSCRKRPLLLWGVPVFVGGGPLKGGDHLCIVSNVYGDVCTDYRQRWSIECLFQSLKGRGFQLEATHICEYERLSRLLGLICIAFVWSYRMGEWLGQEVPLKVKKHKRAAHSIFARGFSFLRRLLLPLSGRFRESDFDVALARLQPMNFSPMHFSSA
jgi:hypothetical protein